MEFEVTFEKKMTYTAYIDANSYEEAEEIAIKMMDEQEELAFQAALKNELFVGWESEAECDPWEIEEILGDD